MCRCDNLPTPDYCPICIRTINLSLANNVPNSQASPGSFFGLNRNISGRTLEEEVNYILFQKYAHLSDQQIIETYYQEVEKLEEQHQQIIKLQESSFKYKQDELHKQLIEWCAKYRKHLTEKKIKDMKVFL
jgi:hypothetical protein